MSKVYHFKDEKEKKKYFMKLHGQILKIYRTPENKFTFAEIGYIRSLTLSKNFTQSQLLKYTENKMYASKDDRNHSINFYFRIYKFIKDLPKKDFCYIT